MPAYLIADITIEDPELFRAYQAEVPAVLARHGGRYLVRGGATEVMEGFWQPARMVIVEFPDMEAVRAFYESPDYAPLIAQRQSASTGSVVFVEGYQT